MLTLVVTLLATAPAAGCNHCELSVSHESPPRAQRLLAQSELPPPPPPPVIAPGAAGSPEQLQLRLDELNREIRGIDTNWPSSLILIAGIGYFAAPTGILVGGLFLLYGVLFSSPLFGAGGSSGLAALGAAFLVSGAVMVLVGIAGVVAIVYAWSRGSAIQAENIKRRDELIRERDQLDLQLRTQRFHGAIAEPVPHFVTLLSF